MGGSHQSLEKRGSIDRVVPGESKRLVRERECKVNPIKPCEVDFLRGKRVRRPVWIVGHYERAFVGGRGRRSGRTSHVEERSGRREKPKEDQDRDRNNKEHHIKKLNRKRWSQPVQWEGRGGEKLNSQSDPLQLPFYFWTVACDDVSVDFKYPTPPASFTKRPRLLDQG